MKPIGTITSCFPHVDEETVVILRSTLTQAKDYDDFAKLLCDKVCAESTNQLATYLAFYFAFDVSNFGLIVQLQNSGKKSILADPFVTIMNVIRKGKTDWDYSQKSIGKAIEVAPNDWIACQLYLEWRNWVEAIYSESFTDLSVMDIIESKIKNDAVFSNFLPELTMIKAMRLHRERSVDKAKAIYAEALSQITEYDNPMVYSTLITKYANLVKRSNIPEALKLLERQRQASESTGFAFGLAHYHHQLGYVAMVRGEFDLALYHQQRYAQITLDLKRPEIVGLVFVAYLYNLLGDGARVLELISDYAGEAISNDSMLFIQKGWAMVNIGRISDAESEIDRARELILKSGNEFRLGLIYLIEGLVERARSELETASFTIQRALDIFERCFSPALISMSLVHLCNIEIESLSNDSIDTMNNISGPWMSKLLAHVETNDIPGFKAISKLLLAKFLFRQAEVSQAQAFVAEVQEAAKNPNMKYLEYMQKHLLPDLEL